MQVFFFLFVSLHIIRILQSARLETNPVLRVWCRTCCDRMSNLFTVISQKKSYNSQPSNFELHFLMVCTVSFDLDVPKPPNTFSHDICFSTLAIYYGKSFG